MKALIRLLAWKTVPDERPTPTAVRRNRLRYRAGLYTPGLQEAKRFVTGVTSSAPRGKLAWPSEFQAMIERQVRNAAAYSPVERPTNLCACPGCRQHVARLEELNAQLARENDRLSRELRGGKRAA